MRIIVLLLFLVVFIVSCRNGTSSEAGHGTDTVQIAVRDSAVVNSVPYSVEYNEDTQALNLIRSNDNIENANVADIIAALNRKHEGVKLELVRAQKDTIAVKINDASKLTQGMGSTGAEAYLAELTFSLTELKGIKAVKIDFEEGDHAMPGVYTREDFKELLTTDKKDK